MSSQTRQPNEITVTLTNSLATTPAVPCHDYAGGHLLIPAAYSSTTITAYVCSTASGTFLPLYDTDGAAVALTVAASRAYDLPVALFAAHWLKLVTNADDSTRSVTLCQKS